MTLPVRGGRSDTDAMTPAERSLVALSRPECLALLGRAQIGRAVFTERALPAVVPVTFAVYGDAIVMCTASDTRLASAATRGVLAFEVDDIDPTTRSGWSLVVTGVAQRVDHELEQARIRYALQPWVPGGHDVFIRLPLTVLTGRRVSSGDQDDATQIG